ncbi:MAG TPA: hypothetical protein VE309_07495, partial [Caulobacteraceae bacterium]|nr:hypothetical protein [Caulobacteraceae bacterium]
MTYTIAISGFSGAGKTSLTLAVAECLDAAAVLHLDDYEYPDPSTVSADVEGWIARGLPLATHNGTTLAGEAERLCAGQSVQRPKADGMISPTPFLVIEEPFGRARPAVAHLIDLAVVIATPPDIALARRVGRDLGHVPRGQKLDDVVTGLRRYLEWYEAAGRAF